MKKLEDVCNIVGGGTPSKRKTEYYNGNIPWATVRDMNVDLLTTTDHSINQLGLDNSSSNLIEEGNLIVASRVGLGKACILGQDTAINQDLKALLPKKKNLDIIFLFYWYQSVANKIQVDGTGMTVKGVTVKYLKNLQIPLPSLPEQKRLVHLLDTAFAEIDRARVLLGRNLENAGELFESRLGEVFGELAKDYKKQPLSALSYLKSGGTPSRRDPKNWTNGNIEWYSSGELNDVFTIDSKEFITQYGLDNSNARIFPEGSLLIGIYDTAALKMSISDRPVTFNQAIVGVEPNENVLMRFLMLGIEAQKSDLLLLRRGTRQKNLSLAKIKAIKVAVPPIKIQKQIIKAVDELFESINSVQTHYTHQLHHLTELKQSLLAKAFGGEL